MIVVSSSPEAKLLGTIQSIEQNPEGYLAVHFHLSQLLEFYRSDYQIRIAVNILNDMLRNEDGAIFMCSNFDLVIICNQTQSLLIEKVVYQLRYLFIEDPLAFSGNQENPDFSTFYNLATSWNRFHQICEELSHNTQRIPKAPKPKAVKKANPILSELHHYASMLQMLQSQDISKALRYQPVCTMPKSNKVNPVFEEIYFKLEHLESLLDPTFNCRDDAFLFNLIARQLDIKLLRLFEKHSHVYFRTPASINLTTYTVLSDHFKQFDRSIDNKVKKSIIIEFSLADIITNSKDFLTASSVLKSAGYCICIDGITYSTIPYLNINPMHVDLFKIEWEAELYTISNEHFAPLMQANAKRVILTKCENKEAVSFGKHLGIQLFQGRYLDRILKPHTTVIN